jgi:hypothetical protein
MMAPRLAPQHASRHRERGTWLPWASQSAAHPLRQCSTPDANHSDEILDQIDEIVPPGTDVGTLDQAYLPPALMNPSLRRRPAGERTAA